MAKSDENKNTQSDVQEVAKNDTVIIFKVNKPLNKAEYAEVEARTRNEEAKTGLKIVLAPFAVDPVLQGGNSNDGKGSEGK